MGKKRWKLLLNYKREMFLYGVKSGVYNEDNQMLKKNVLSQSFMQLCNPGKD